MVAPRSCAAGALDGLAELRAVKEVVAEHQRGLGAVEELLADEEGLRQSLGLRLLGVFEPQAELRSIAEELLESGQVVRRGDDEDVPDVREHERGERVVDHRLVIDRHELLAHRDGERIEPGAGAACENDAFACHALMMRG